MIDPSLNVPLKHHQQVTFRLVKRGKREKKIKHDRIKINSESRLHYIEWPKCIIICWYHLIPFCVNSKKYNNNESTSNIASILNTNLLLLQKRITSRTYITLLWYMRDLLPLNVKTNHIIIHDVYSVLQKTKKHYL